MCFIITIATIATINVYNLCRDQRDWLKEFPFGSWTFNPFSYTDERRTNAIGFCMLNTVH